MFVKSVALLLEVIVIATRCDTLFSNLTINVSPSQIVFKKKIHTIQRKCLKKINLISR